MNITSDDKVFFGQVVDVYRFGHYHNHPNLYAEIICNEPTFHKLVDVWTEAYSVSLYTPQKVTRWVKFLHFLGFDIKPQPTLTVSYLQVSAITNREILIDGRKVRITFDMQLPDATFIFNFE